MLLKNFFNLFKSKKEKYYKEVYSQKDIEELYSNEYIYFNLKEEIKRKTPLVSMHIIRPLDKIDFDRISLKELKYNFGKPRLKYNVKLGDRKVRLSLYKSIFSGIKTTITSHFFQNKLFNLRYEFKTNSSDEFIQIRDLISLKYLEGQEIDIENEYIVDERNTVISFNKDFNIIVNYHNNSEIFEYVYDLIDKLGVDKSNRAYKNYKKLYKKL